MPKPHHQLKFMSKIFIQENGKIRNIADVELAEDIIKKRNERDPWEVIDSLVKLWAERAPEDVEAMRINVEQYRETLADKRFGQTLGGKVQERRFTLAFPRTLMWMIRSQYKVEELPFDKEFYHEFGKRYPFFKVAQEV